MELWDSNEMAQLPSIRSGEFSVKELLGTEDGVVQGTRSSQLHEFLLEWMRLDSSQAPGPKLAVLIQTIFGVAAVAIFDACLGRLDKVGYWSAGEEEVARDCYVHDLWWYDPKTQLSQCPLRVGSISFGALVVYGDLGPLLVEVLAALATVAVERHQRFEKEFKASAAGENELTKHVEQPRADGTNGKNEPDLRRSNAIRYGEIELYPAKHRVLKNGQEIHLTPKEFAILHHLMQSAGDPVPHDQLLKAIWGQQYGTEHEYLRTYVRQIRIKIEDDPAHPRYLKVVPSLGYMFEEHHPAR